MGENFYVKSPKSIAATQTDDLVLSEESGSPQIPYLYLLMERKDRLKTE